MSNAFIIRDTAANFTAGNPTLLANQWGVETDIRNNVNLATGKCKLGDGMTAWNSLSYWSPSGSVGNVTGPASSTDGVPALFDGVTGQLLKNSKVTLTQPATGSTLTVVDGKTLTASNSLTLAGTDSTTMTFPGASANIGYLEVPVNSQSVDYTAVLADSGKMLLQTGTSKTFTIPANGPVPYPVGTALTFVVTAASGCSIAITTDTMTLANSTTTGTRTLAQNGVATALKLTSTTWLISGQGLS